MIAEAIDIKGVSFGQSKVVQTKPPDRNTKIFLEEQEWLEEHMPTDVSDTIQQPPGSHQGGSSIQTSHESYQSDGGRRDARMPLRKQKLLAYMGGFLTCLIAFVLCWTASCVNHKLRRRRRVQGYTQVDKDNREGDYELDESSGK